MKKTTINCLGFIMDGNRRWAKEQGLETFEGHHRGHEVFVDCVRFIRDQGIPHAVFYAFSTENWNRKANEVTYLMGLFTEVINQIKDGVDEEKVRVRFLGEREAFPAELRTSMVELETKSARYGETTIWIALSYGGRAELMDAVNKAVRKGEQIGEDGFKKLLWTAEMPDPDMIVRTSGEQRLSNFLPWNSVYSEFLFLDKHWPALTQDDFDGILKEYESRERRQGT